MNPLEFQVLVLLSGVPETAGTVLATVPTSHAETASYAAAVYLPSDPPSQLRTEYRDLGPDVRPSL